jgi:hypothetical protein
MGTPTFPSLWLDVLTQLNNVLNWDFVKGGMILFTAIALGGTAVATIRAALHR